MDDVGVDLLGHHRQAALLPGQPGGPVRERGRSGHHARVRGKPLVALLVGALADNGQIRASDVERPRYARGGTATETLCPAVSGTTSR